LLTVAALLPLPARQQPDAAPPADQVHARGCVRVFYQTSGRHAVAPADADANGVPDSVEDILTQALAARKLWGDALGFPDPLASPRFAGADRIHLYMRHRDDLPTREDREKWRRITVNGKSYSSVMKHRLDGDAPGSGCLQIRVSSTIRPSKGQTVAHEYFHLVQYGAFWFRPAWLMEGTARWSEKGLGKGALGPLGAFQVWPPREHEITLLTGLDYPAANIFWNPLARSLEETAAAGDDGLLPDNDAIRDLQTWRYTDGKPVLQDLRLSGWRFMRRLFADLPARAAAALREDGGKKWTLANQRSPRNDSRILRAIGRALGPDAALDAAALRDAASTPRPSQNNSPRQPQ
jgi:hypothetical protein